MTHSFPQSADELFVAALRLEDAGQQLAALARYGELLQLVPGHANAWHNRGLLLARMGRLGEADQSHREYVRLHPDDPRAQSDLADVLIALERYDEALHHAGRAAALDSRAFLPSFSAALACSMLQRFDEARDWFRRAHAADPAGFARFLGARSGAWALDRDLDPRSIYLIREFDRLQACDWRGRDAYLETFSASVEAGVASPPLLLRSLALPISIAARRRLADSAAALIARGAARSAGAPPASRGGRVRLGYLSPDFRTHPAGILSAPLFRLHNRARFEVHAFSLSGGDGSPWRRAIEGSADRFHSISGLGGSTVVAAVTQAGIDVLVDLAGATTGAFPEVLAARAAPVQVSYLGFPGGSGRGLVDYLICDATCVPADEGDGYGEALARLPSTFWICEPFLPPVHSSRALCGLPDQALVLYAHHPGQKIYPELFTAWMEILRRSPRAVLWLLEDASAMRDNLLREARARGVEAERLVFAPRVPYADYRARIPLADLALDTPIYNGGATTLDALMAGVPVLSCPAPGFAGRMAASALYAAGLGELVVPDLGAYVDFATRFVAEEPLRKRLVAQVRAAGASPLFDALQRTREIEAAFEHMLAAAAGGEPPRSFQVPAV